MSFSVMFKKLEQKAAGVSAVAFPLSLIIFTYEREIVPLYGSAPTTRLLETIAAATSLLAAVQPFQIPLQTNLLFTGIALTLAPNTTYWVAVWSARRKDPVWGPAITHASVLAPLTFLLTTFVVEMDDPDAKVSSEILRLYGRCIKPVSHLAWKFYSPFPFLTDTSGHDDLSDIFSIIPTRL